MVGVILGLQPALTGRFAAVRPDFGRTYTRFHAARYCSALIKLANPSSGLSQVFEVLASADATLSGLALEDGDGNTIPLDTTFASDDYEYEASVAGSVDEITVEPETSHINATVTYENASGTALTDTDTNTDGHQVSLEVGDTTIIKVIVKPEDGLDTKTYTVVVTRAPPPEVTVPNYWGLIPSGLGTGDKFRLLFLSSTKTDATSTSIGGYNRFIHERAEAGHADLDDYIKGFRVVGCTAVVDARDNTGTTGAGVPIYWVNGNKVADDNADFYDGSWDDEANDKNESGADGPDTSVAANYPVTGCSHAGREWYFEGTSNALGATNVRVGQPNASGANNGPLRGDGTVSNTATRPMYGLSQVFEVAPAPAPPPEVTVPNDWGLIPSEIVTGNKFRLLFLSSEKTDATSTDITVYNTWIQNRAGAGHADLDDYIEGFRVVGCTAAVDARDNTFTTGTGVPIYWLNGSKAADHNADFYNGNWDDEVNDKDESGNDGPDTSQSSNYPFTGCNNAGREFISSSDTSLALGATNVRVGRPNSDGSGEGPLGSNTEVGNTATRPMYGLSQVFEVAAPLPVTVPNDWGLIPSGLHSGDQFRLLFLSSTKRNGSPTSIADYNTWIQERAEAGHADLGDYTEGFRVVGCTAAVGARGNTSTKTDGAGVPIYWLNGNKAADDNADFYDGSWDDEVNDKNESGNNGPDTSDSDNFPLTGCNGNGSPSTSPLGNSTVRVGRPNSADHSPLSSGGIVTNTHTRPMYGLSLVFEVGAPVPPPEATVPNDWGLVPSGLVTGNKFRLLFLSSEKTDATSTRIADYNTWIQKRAEAGHADLGDYIEGFRVVGCTAAVDARDNTGTNTNTDGAGVPIYWVNGSKVADHNTDFYDASWDDEANDKNESGNNGPDTSQDANRPYTGCNHNGTKSISGSTSVALGASFVRTGRPDDSGANNGPLSSGSSGGNTVTRPVYGLSQVFEVVSSADATLRGLALEDGDGNTIPLTPPFVTATRTYTASVGNSVSSTTVTAQTTHPNATTVIKLRGTEDLDGTVDLAVGANTITVEVTSQDGTAMLTYTVTVTRAGPLSTDATLRSLDLSNVTLSPPFLFGTITYTASVANSVTSTTVTAQTTNSNATRVIKLDGTVDTDGTVALAEGDNIITVEVTAEDTVATRTYQVTVTRATDTANLVLSRSSLGVGEAGSDTFTVKLATLPSATVTVTVTSDNTDAATVSPASLTFTTTNWNSTQTVTVSGKDDTDTANESLTVTASASGGGYGGKMATVSVTVTDDDTGLTAVTFGASSYTATEGGSGATVVVRLSQAPATQVTIPLTTMLRGGATGGDYSGIPDDVMFTSGQMQRTFTVTAVDDSDDDDGESVRIGFDELPSGYAQGSPAMTTVALLDDEGSRRVVVGFTTHTAYVVERRESESRFWVPVRLDREPLRSVTIPLVVTHLGGATAADYSGIPASVTFGPNDTKADFFMRVIPDEEREIGEGLRIDFGDLPSSVSKDWWAPYETIEFVDDLLDSTVWFGTDAYTATEGAAAAQVSIHLDAPVKLEPLDVGLVLRYGGGATAADHGSIPAVVRFAIGERTKTITVAATNDSDDDDGESVTLSFVNVRDDRVNIAFQPVRANTTTVSLADNDGPMPVTVSFGAATYTAREGGSGASVSVELDATPGRSVTVPLTTTHRGGATGADYSGVPSSVTFGSNETQQTFTVTATNDTADDDGESLSIGFGTLPASVSAGSPAVVALDDDDGSSVRRVRVGFDTGVSIAFQVRESAWPSRITLSLNRVAQRTVTIPLVVTHLGGATAADYTGIPASVTFGPDQRRVGFSVYGTLDEEIETGEGLRIEFGTLPPGVRVDSWRSYETVEFVDTSTAP